MKKANKPEKKPAAKAAPKKRAETMRKPTRPGELIEKVNAAKAKKNAAILSA